MVSTVLLQESGIYAAAMCLCSVKAFPKTCFYRTTCDADNIVCISLNVFVNGKLSAFSILSVLNLNQGHVLLAPVLYVNICKYRTFRKSSEVSNNCVNARPDRWLKNVFYAISRV